jgi:hypothetical protein
LSSGCQAYNKYTIVYWTIRSKEFQYGFPAIIGYNIPVPIGCRILEQ